MIFQVPVVVVGLSCATTKFFVCGLSCFFGLLCAVLPVGLLTGCCCWIFRGTEVDCIWP